MVKRWDVHEAFRMEEGLIVERKVGNVYSSNPDSAFIDVVLAEDYDALAARLAAAEAVAAADGTLHNAIDHWQERAKAAEARLAEAERDRDAWRATIEHIAAYGDQMLSAAAFARAALAADSATGQESEAL